ncbi:reverse transcriptase domain-containing protein [Tanacetum coccineum]|uniref:Reverse transcriptase domain-containing protein n=1 Tax=Tanacetum coccineum TaxID=301880 RepID=A0ABQ5J770_9ASTR
MIRGKINRKRSYGQMERWMDNEISFPSVQGCQLVDSPIIVEALIEGFQVRWIYVDGGSSSEVMYEHCFRNLWTETKARLIESRTPLVGFSEEVNYPMGVINLNVTMGEPGKLRTVTMEFVVVKSHSPYNVILGRTALRSLGAVASTIHSMIKFHTDNEIATMVTKRETLQECRRMEEAQGPVLERRITHPRIQASGLKETTIKEKEEIQEQNNEKEETDKSGQSSSSHPYRETIWGKKDKEKDELPKEPNESKPSKKVIIHDGHPDHTVTIGGNLTTESEHELKTYPHIEPRIQRKKSITLDRRKVVKKEVAEWLKDGIVKRVRYPSWVANPVLVKKPDNSWRMCIDFKDLNKACPKDLYPLPEIDWKIESLMGFKYKCFLDAYKGYHQIQMAKKDEEKTAFHTDEGVFCYTKMPFGLKNVKATYQRLVDTTFVGEMGRNLEAYVDDMVIKSKTELDMIKDIEETLLTLKKVNMKLNPKKCSFGMEEGKFLGYIVTSEGIRANPEKTKAVMNMPSPSSLKQMQRLSECQKTSLHMQERMGKDETSMERKVPEVRRTVEDQIPTGENLILIDPEGAEYSYALRGNFTNSNNDAEYEALLAGLRITAKMKVKKMHAFVDSKLVASQVEGSYEARGEKTKKYREKVLEMVRSFSNFRKSHIPREENKKDDALSKLAVLQCEGLTKGILIE